MQCTAAAAAPPRGLAATVVPLFHSTTFESHNKLCALILVRLWHYISHVLTY